MSRIVKGAVVAALALACGPALWRLADAGRTNEYAGHAMFVPLFCVLAAWADRDRLRAAAGPGHPAGMLLLGGGAALLAAGYGWPSQVLQGLAMAVLAGGAVLWLFGWACLRAAVFPVVFLAMMAPLPRPVVAAVTRELQVFAAGFAAGVLRLVGIPVYHTGVDIELATMKLEVAEVCNGLRFLLAILVLTAAFAQVLLPSWRRKVMLVVAAIPIAILANAVRVAVIAVGVHYVGPEAASGTVHNWIGKGVWAITLLPLAGLTLGLARFRLPPRTSADVTAVPASKVGIA
jgi:exosortase